MWHEQNDPHFADDILKYISANYNVWTSIQILHKIVMRPVSVFFDVNKNMMLLNK